MCLEKLEGHGCLELDLEMAQREEQLLQRQLALVQQKLRECEDFYRGDFHVSKEFKNIFQVSNIEADASYLETFLDDVIVTYIEDVWSELRKIISDTCIYWPTNFTSSP